MIGQAIRFLVSQRLLVVAVAGIVSVGGVVAYQNLIIDVFPDPSPALVQIYTEAHGLAPQEVEQLVSVPVEAAMFGLPRVERIRSSSTYGLSVVNVYFEEGTDIYWARQVLAPRLHEIEADLPPQAHEPFLGPIATGLGMVYMYYLEGEGYSAMELRTLQDWLVKYELKSVPEVSQVLTIGGDVQQFQVLVDPNALLEFDLTLADLLDRIEAGNRNAAAGFITRGPEEFIVRSIGLVETVDDLRNIVVAHRGGTPIFLSSVAQVELLPAIKRGAALADGRGERVVGLILKLFGSNTANVIDRLEDQIEAVNASLPEGVEIVPFYNQAAFVRACFSTVATNLGLGVVLVIGVLFLLMGHLPSAFLTMLTLPFSVLFAFIVMQRFGVAADLMSFGGLAIGIGLIADAAIIYVENTYRHIQGGMDRISALVRSGEEVTRPIFFAIIIIVLVFLPIFTLQGTEGIMFRPMGLAISAALIGSLFFTLVVIPALGSIVLGKKAEQKREDPVLIRTIRHHYLKLFEWCRTRRRRVFVITGSVLALGLVLLPFTGREYMPTLKEGTLQLQVTMNANVSIGQSIAQGEELERRLMAMPGVTGVLTRIGRGEAGSHGHFVNDLHILIQLDRRGSSWRRMDLEEIQDEISHELDDIPGITMNLSQPIAHNLDELITGARAQLAIRIFGEGADTLQDLSTQMEEVLMGVEGAVDVQTEKFTGQNNLVIELDRSAMARYGLNVDQVQGTVEAAIGGVIAGQVYEGRRRFDIFLRFQPQYRRDIEQIYNLLIPLPDGGRIPLNQVATIEETEDARVVNREDSRRFSTVQANVRGRDMGRFVEEAQAAVAEQIELPAGYSVRWGGQFELQERSRRTFLIVTPLTLLLVSILLYAIFGSVVEAGVILINIPLALTGGLAALMVSGQYMSVPASIGFIAIFGIALEDGLVLLSTIRRRFRGGDPVSEAVRYGVTAKLRPVLMTTFTTIFGILPLLLASGPGAEIQRPLGTVVLGGLLTSTLVTLVVLPLVYQAALERDPTAGRRGQSIRH
ncbi:MAG: efflux RND transporter permease subunit [Gemmatimonadetes bacterium]|nr:efflux RND transporter permease subunit [Gemmatimonadota bacterium]